MRWISSVGKSGNLLASEQSPPNSITLSNLDGTLMHIRWDPSRQVVTLERNGQAEVLLSGCDFFRFNISQRNPSNGVFGFYPTSDIRQAKLVDLNWRCQRALMGQLLQTESVQTPRIVIRN
ncbi:MAG: hypothetical protein RMN51_06465 [Verrucomicrobiota bacterium]|nr:hypothetical protein [Limisphaera sp.]MDW8381734.1 hypothetical protein [Verrucomicrobiota bacterium]